MGFVCKAPSLDAMDAGTHTTVAAVDTVQTDLREVLYATAQLASTPLVTIDRVTVSIPDQVANPGKITISGWKPTGATDATPIAASVFSKVVHWLAFGR